MATANRMKFLTQRNDARMALVLPKELKEILAQKANDEKMNESQWVKLTIIEKLEREETNQEY